MRRASTFSYDMDGLVLAFEVGPKEGTTVGSCKSDRMVSGVDLKGLSCKD